MYINTETLQCESKKAEYVGCTSTIECLGTMTCEDGLCQCSITKYFNPITMQCVDRTKNNSVCATNNTCRADLGLSCQNGRCQCDSTLQFWHATLGKCIEFLTYNGTGCTSDNHCLTSEGLICNMKPTANPCNCPATSISGMCDCKRVKGNEYYWDGSKCVQAVVYGTKCTIDYNCQVLTQLTFCNLLTSKCSLLIYDEPCTSDPYCDYYRNLTCISGKCKLINYLFI